MNYNLKVIEYLDSLQIRAYKRPVSMTDSIAMPQISADDISVVDIRQQTAEQKEHSIRTSMNRTVNQIYAISRSNHWEYFVTLTIDPDLLDSTDFNLVSEKINIWTNNLKKRYAPELKYIFVPELHKDKKKWHFHGLFSQIGTIPLVFSGKVCIGKYIYDYVRKPYATKIYNIPLWKYGFSTVTAVRDTSKAGSYLAKYITKDVSRSLHGQHRYLASHNIHRPVEYVLNLDYTEMEQVITKHLSRLSYMSNIKVPAANQEILYMEFNKNPAAQNAPFDFKFFEPEAVPAKMFSSDRPAGYIDPPVPHVPHKSVSPDERLQELYKLRDFLKENPAQYKLYDDINIEQQIRCLKNQILERKVKNDEHDRQIGDGFTVTDDSPFL